MASQRPCPSAAAAAVTAAGSQYAAELRPGNGVRHIVVHVVLSQLGQQPRSLHQRHHLKHSRRARTSVAGEPRGRAGGQAGTAAGGSSSKGGAVNGGSSSALATSAAATAHMLAGVGERQLQPLASKVLQQAV